MIPLQNELCCKAMLVYLGHNITNFYFQYSIASIVLLLTHNNFVLGEEHHSPLSCSETGLSPALIHYIQIASQTVFFNVLFITIYYDWMRVRVLKILKAFLFKSRCSSSHNAMTMKPIKSIM